MAIKLIVVLILLSVDFSCCLETRLEKLIKFDLFTVNNSTLGSYLTKIAVGTPPKIFNVVVDTGSDLTWIDCSNTERNFYEVSHSSTATVLPLNFNISYKDGTYSYGYLVSDVFHFNTFLSSRIVFGCSMTHTLGPSKDGVLGLGRSKESLISQLYSQRIAPKSVSHCLSHKADGYLLLSEILEDGFTYSPLIPSKSKYQVSLESISVNGRKINVKLFEGEDGTIVDSGTTRTMLVAGVYDALVDAVSIALNKSFLPGFISTCYEVPSRDSFPQITFDLADGASLLLMPQDYLQHLAYNYWCLSFERDDRISILGDVVLRDKVVVYDQPRERVGWLSRDCSQSVNVSYNFTSGSLTWRAMQNRRFCWSNVLLLFTGFYVTKIVVGTLPTTEYFQCGC